MNGHPLWRWTLLGLGVLLIVAAPLVGIIPGPGGVFVFAAGLVLVLRNSLWARRRWARLKRRWPKVGGGADIVMRRPSALRRRERDRTDPDRAQLG